jgi:hypothetical protein
MRIRIHDLSLGGCLIEAPMAITVGCRLTLRLDLPGEDWLSLQGEAVRVAAQSTFAVKFIDMDDITTNRLQRVIDQLTSNSLALDSTLGGAADVH